MLRAFLFLVGRTADMAILNFGQKMTFIFGVMQKNPQFRFQMAEILHAYSKAPQASFKHIFKSWGQNLDLNEVQYMFKSYIQNEHLPQL